MRIALKLACIGAVVMLAGCSFWGKPSRNAPAELVDFKETMAVHAVWSLSVGSAGAFTFVPALGTGSIYAAAADGSISRVDAATGRAIWRIDAGMPLTAGVGSDGAYIAVAGDKGKVLVFDDEGKLLWKEQASSEILSSPAVGQGLVIVRSVDNQIVAFDAKSGTRKWILRRSVPALTLRNASGILISGSTAYVGLPGGRLLALSLNNGTPRWEAVVGDPHGATELERVADVSGTPVLIGREICAVSYQGRVACFDAINGGMAWSKDLSSDVGLAADERFIFAADEHGVVSAFLRDTGTSVWRNTQLANRRLSTPVSFGRAVAVGDGQGYLHFLSREDGSFLARVSTDDSPIVAAPLVAGENVIVQTKDGKLIALGIQ
ncbi:MAG TPA: outer membrane protein assembly factor BamB [Burkholderiaceae bacterium]|jgi:outer membrane protein assembly factor BamB